MKLADKITTSVERINDLAGKLETAEAQELFKLVSDANVILGVLVTQEQSLGRVLDELTEKLDKFEKRE